MIYRLLDRTKINTNNSKTVLYFTDSNYNPTIIFDDKGKDKPGIYITDENNTTNSRIDGRK
jgi:hypothetical protein